MIKGPSSCRSQDVTFENASFPNFHSAVTARPIETKRLWERNERQSGAIGQMARGSDISDSLLHVCARAPEECASSDFQPDPTFERSRTRQSARSIDDKRPRGTVTVRRPLFQSGPSAMLGSVPSSSENSLSQQRIKCQGLSFQKQLCF